jgi:PDZ-binding kinase
MAENYEKTPLKIFKKKHLIGKDSLTPLKIPASPLLEKLGLGTGVEILKITRSPRNNTVRSPWAIKRISKRCVARNSEMNNVYSKRLVQEADLLKNLKHPNIIGFRALQQLNSGPCIAMEVCNISLGNLLEKRLEEESGPLPANNILKVSLFLI